MGKKELRKELEINLVREIETVLNKLDSSVTSKIRKTTYEASKLVAKKFYKASKPKITGLSSAKAGMDKSKPAKIVKTAKTVASSSKNRTTSKKDKK